MIRVEQSQSEGWLWFLPFFADWCE